MKARNLLALSTGLAMGALLLAGAPAGAQPQGLDIGKVSLDLAFQPGPLTPGKLKIRGIVDDNDTENIVADFLSDTTTIRIQDGGDFDHTTTITGCRETPNSVVCRGDSTGYRVAAYLKRWKNLPDVWRLNLRVKDLVEADTGFGPLSGPVTVTMEHGATVRTDIVGNLGGNEQDCKVKKNGARLRCKAK